MDCAGVYPDAWMWQFGAPACCAGSRVMLGEALGSGIRDRMCLCVGTSHATLTH